MSFKYENGPEVNIELLVKEVEQAINDEKLDQIDYDRKALEIWPDSGNDAYPEMKKYAAQWEEFCDHVELVTDNDGKGFPEDIQKLFKAKDTEIAEAVNKDADFWQKLREEVIPYYDRCKEKDYWNERWLSIDFWYDPIGMEVTTNRIERVMNADMTLGEVKSRSLVSQRTIPCGFVIRIN
jgi:hypothetical protein